MTAETLDQLKDGLLEGYDRLRTLNVFDAVEIEIEKSATVSGSFTKLVAHS
jgi:hypothetical protein